MSVLQWLTTIFGGLSALLGALKSAGVPVGNVGDQVLSTIEHSEVDLANYESGQAVPIANFSVAGEPGYLVAVKAGGPAAASLGL